MAAKPADHPAIAVFEQMSRIDMHVRANISKHLPAGVSSAQYEVLRLLDRRGEGQTPAEIARALGAAKSGFTNTLQRLESAGLVRSEPCGQDGRKKRISLTPAGRELYLGVVQAVRPRMEQLRDAFTLDEFRAALPFLKALNAWFEEV